jgi:hypothetical protein
LKTFGFKHNITLTLAAGLEARYSLNRDSMIRQRKPPAARRALEGGTHSDSPYINNIFEVAPLLKAVAMAKWPTVHPILLGNSSFLSFI